MAASSTSERAQQTVTGVFVRRVCPDGRIVLQESAENAANAVA